MQEILKAQHGKDWIAVADLLEYKLIPLLKQWNEFIPQTIEEIKNIRSKEE